MNQATEPVRTMRSLAVSYARLRGIFVHCTDLGVQRVCTWCEVKAWAPQIVWWPRRQMAKIDTCLMGGLEGQLLKIGRLLQRIGDPRSTIAMKWGCGGYLRSCLAEVLCALLCFMMIS